ncbi:hypothetical protein BASA50_009913 [Batrachochytrium salamandrivorans]|uniref:Uncharacterized protein n=1 Tax=Batrachochytrium salamandrivorans TaxID=1357716 RepID=A0ABQ8EZZ1_9FUNG|nr:hypothetical protein BASA50_009913 [Batrachochytrium salamandrivorans]
MILPLLLLPLVSLGVVAQHPGQRQTVDFSPQPSYRLVFPPTHFTPATYVCTGSNIKFQTNHAHRLTQEIERLCEEAIEKIKKKPCPPQAMIAEYDRNGAECKRLKEEAKMLTTHGIWHANMRGMPETLPSYNKSNWPPHSVLIVSAIQKSRLRLLGRALDPGVENVYTWLRGGVLNGEADLDQRWLDGTVEHESMGTRHDNRVLGSNGLADFLQVVYWAASIHFVANTTW